MKKRNWLTPFEPLMECEFCDEGAQYQAQVIYSTTASGEAEVDYICENCAVAHIDLYRKITPLKEWTKWLEYQDEQNKKMYREELKRNQPPMF